MTPTPDQPLDVFPDALRSLLLRGGDGLPCAYGPIKSRDGHLWTLDPSGFALRMVMLDGEPIRSGVPVLERPELWFLPLDAESPWPARLALVAAWMASAWMPSGAFAEVILGDCWLHLYTYSGGVADIRAWSCDDGGNMEPGAVRSDLPTLPQHLQTRPPAVALVLALWDVPDIRARVGGV